ncbi:MAG: hypothetical protein KBT27_04065, partial [Prevotellaceae bacterium]|nr:hypothetical protein [Candidatus Faecinaster equi]
MKKTLLNSILLIAILIGMSTSVSGMNMTSGDEESDYATLMSDVENALKTLTPKNHHDNNGSQPWLLGNEKLSMEGLVTSIEYIDALKAAKDVVVDLHNQGKTLSEMGEAVEKLRMAMIAVNAKFNPLTEGYYYIVAE